MPKGRGFTAMFDKSTGFKILPFFISKTSKFYITIILGVFLKHGLSQNR